LIKYRCFEKVFKIYTQVLYFKIEYQRDVNFVILTDKHLKYLGSICTALITGSELFGIDSSLCSIDEDFCSKSSSTEGK